MGGTGKEMTKIRERGDPSSLPLLGVTMRRNTYGFPIDTFGNDRERIPHQVRNERNENDKEMRFLRCEMSTFGMTRRDGMTRGWLGRKTPLSSPCPFLSSPGLTGGSMHLCQRSGFPIRSGMTGRRSA